MYIFYDFETSSREFIGQILSYAFIVTDLDLNIKDDLCGTIKLNPTQLPEPEAILVNRINIQEHQKTGEPEPIAAKKIAKFLSEWALKSPFCSLVGFNSNAFDLQFLRNLLIRHGINPYFRGQLKNLDILHFARHLAITNKNTFKWHQGHSEQTQSPYWQFKLETLATDYGILSETQSHDAREDVELTIKLTKKLQEIYQKKLIEFTPYTIDTTILTPLNDNIGCEMTIGWSEDQTLPEKTTPKLWKLIVNNKKDALALNINDYDHNNPESLTPLRYINSNKQFFHLIPPTSDQLNACREQRNAINQNSFLSTLTMHRYFELTAKNWDIEYQIHCLGFDHITTLKTLINRINKSPTHYTSIIAELMNNRTKPEDSYLIQLFNRYYINNSPNVPIELMQRYIIPRYEKGTFHRDPSTFRSFDDQLKTIDDLLTRHQQPNDQLILRALNAHYLEFQSTYMIYSSTR